MKKLYLFNAHVVWIVIYKPLVTSIDITGTSFFHMLIVNENSLLTTTSVVIKLIRGFSNV